MINYDLFNKVFGEDYKYEGLEKENYENALNGIKNKNIVFMEDIDGYIYACVQNPFMQKIYLPEDIKYETYTKPYEILHGSLEDVHDIEVIKFIESKTDEELAMYIVLSAYYEEDNDSYHHINRVLKGYI